MSSVCLNRPKLGWINQKSCFNQLKESENLDELVGLVGISPSERLGCMFQTGLYSDCSFLVENEEIRVHKLILAAASPKMEQMFLGSDSDQNEVQFSLRVMDLILKHVYLQDMDISSIDEAQDVIEAAYFFEMPDLVELCCAGIEPEAVEDLWPALNLACLYGSKSLKEACLGLALKNSNILLEQEGFLNLTPEALSFLLSREVIEVQSEENVIEVVISWAKNRLEASNSSNLRFELESSGVLQQLRILSLSEQNFIEFITSIGTEIFTEEELDKLEYNYYNFGNESFISPIRTERLLEQRVPLCGTDYLAVNSETSDYQVNVKIYETSGLRPIIKMLVIPSQINPANILYDNVSHRTHYDEFILVEIRVKNRTISRGSFCDRIKYGEDVFVPLNTFNYTPVYCRENEEDYYEATIKIVFKKFGYYPLAVETKCDQSYIVLEEPCRFIHEFVLMTPKM